MFCSACGGGLQDNDCYCGRCGAATTNIENRKPAKKEPSSVGMIVGAAALVMLGFVGLRSCTIAAPSSTLFASPNIDTRGFLTGGLSASCTPDRFSIREENETTEDGYVTVVGVVHNGCSEPASPQLKLSQYSATGHLVATADQWATDLTNIRPYGDYQFKVMDTAADGAVKYSLSVIDVHRW